MEYYGDRYSADNESAVTVTKDIENELASEVVTRPQEILAQRQISGPPADHVPKGLAARNVI